MNYRKVHDQIIERARLREKEEGAYYERHHVIPRCMGGLNDKENLVYLTARENFLVHWLLVEIHRGSEFHGKLSYAWWMMSKVGNITGQESRRISSRYFEYAKKEAMKFQSVLAKMPKPSMYKKEFDFEIVMYNEISKKVEFEGHFRDYANDHRKVTQIYSYFQKKVTSNKGEYKGCTHFTKSYFYENEKSIRLTTRISGQIISRKLPKSPHSEVEIILEKNGFVCECRIKDLDGRPDRYFNQAKVGHVYGHGPKKGIKLKLK